MLRYLNKAKFILILTIVSICLFILIVVLEKKAVNYTPTKKVVFCIKDVKRKDKLDSLSFIIGDVPITRVDKDTVTDISEIKDKYAKENIYSNEPLNRKRISTLNEIEDYSLNPDERMMAISFSSIESVVGGVLRKNDVVDMTFTNTPSAKEPSRITKTLIQSIRVLGAIDGTGKYIDEMEKNVPANTLLIAVTPEKGTLIDNCSSTGKIRIMKVPQGAVEYKPITVIDGEIKNGSEVEKNDIEKGAVPVSPKIETNK